MQVVQREVEASLENFNNAKRRKFKGDIGILCIHARRLRTTGLLRRGVLDLDARLQFADDLWCSVGVLNFRENVWLHQGNF